MRTKGKIISWNEDKGYGFVSSVPEGRKLFVHITAFGNRANSPKVGQIITYDPGSDKQGRACAVRATMAGDKSQKRKRKKPSSIQTVIAVIFLGVVAASVLAEKLPPIILLIYVLLSIITYLMYAADKSAAKKGNWRTQESTLHLFAIAGGWPGALLAQKKLRHKSKKEDFRFVFWITVILNCGVLVWLSTAKGSSLLNTVLSEFL